MPEEIIPGLYRLPIPLPNNSLGSVNVYAAVSADGLQLIDSGWNAPEVYIALVDELRELGMQVALPHQESDCAFFTQSTISRSIFCVFTAFHLSWLLERSILERIVHASC